MSRYYLFDAHFMGANAPLLDVRTPDPSTGMVDVRGDIYVKIPDSLRIAREPLHLQDLLDLKSQALQDANVLTNMVLDHGVLGSSWDPATPYQVQVGARGGLSLRPTEDDFGSFDAYDVRTATYALGTTPTAYKFSVEAFRVEWVTNPQTGYLTRMVSELSNTSFMGQMRAYNIYFNSTYPLSNTTAGHLDTVHTIPSIFQGSTFQVGFRVRPLQWPGGPYEVLAPIHLGGWSLSYS